MKNGLSPVVKGILVFPASILGYILFTTIGILVVKVISMFVMGQEISLLEFAGARDFNGLSYLNGIWYVIVIRVPGVFAFFSIPLEFFPNHKNRVLWIFVALYSIVAIIAVIAMIQNYNSVINGFETLVRVILEFYLIPIVIIIWIKKDINK